MVALDPRPALAADPSRAEARSLHLEKSVVFVVSLVIVLLLTGVVGCLCGHLVSLQI